MRQMNTARRQGHWDARAAGNFIAGGCGTGLVLASAMAHLLNGSDVTVPLLTGLVLVGVGLSLVWLEIGKPWRALNVFFHPQTSWMTREGILAGPLLVAGAAAAWLDSPFALALAALLAAGFLYCQARILRAARAIPAWSHPRTVPLIVLTGLAEGWGAYLVLGEPSPPMIAVTVGLLGAREIAREAWRRGLIATKAPEGTLAWFVRPEERVLQILRVAAMVLLLAGMVGAANAAMLGGALAVITGWGLKAILVTRAAYTRGLRIPRTPTRGRSAARVVDPS